HPAASVGAPLSTAASRWTGRWRPSHRRSSSSLACPYGLSRTCTWAEIILLSKQDAGSVSKRLSCNSQDGSPPLFISVRTHFGLAFNNEDDPFANVGAVVCHALKCMSNPEQS